MGRDLGRGKPQKPPKSYRADARGSGMGGEQKVGVSTQMDPESQWDAERDQNGTKWDKMGPKRDKMGPKWDKLGSWPHCGTAW